ncbi:unnamed protein product [Rangifer tarandus platyrhynchus]|uniref:Uncharacterized protein n=1 Tax=Rangifer tarandus platyrhynchus TaxID=3082113 RepID=A0ABN8ZB87_RANTA|nr:unnamed protein product [Rangifer tarandus platyrhynchus]
MDPVDVPFLSSSIHASSVVSHGHLMTAVHLSFTIYSFSLTPDSKKRTPVTLHNGVFIRIICKYILSISRPSFIKPSGNLIHTPTTSFRQIKNKIPHNEG